MILSGRIAGDSPDWVYLPVRVPAGVNRISVAYRYDRRPGNALDIGLFDGSGGFRGWSGGARDAFTVGATDATPGYLPGPVRAGTWHVVLGPYEVGPDGLDWTVTVTLDDGPDGPAFAPRPAAHHATGRGPAWYRGDTHLHTVHSDGSRTPAEVVAAARAAGLDFVVSTDHNTSSTAGVWGRYADPHLLVIDGEEVTTRDGHYTALGLPAGTWIDWRYRAADGVMVRHVDEIHRAGGLAVAAHPYAPCAGCWWAFGFAGLDGIEVWNGPWTLDDEATLAAWDELLAAGTWLPAVGGSDAHREPDVIGLPQTVVYAAGLDRAHILAGLRAGRMWVAESAAVDLSLTAFADAGRRAGTGDSAGRRAGTGDSAGRRAGTGDSAGRRAGIGERLDVDGADPVTVSLAVNSGDLVRLVTDRGPVVTGAPPGVTWTTTASAARYVRAEARHAATGTMVALTNPIFIGPP
jgi:hypothetical protein